MDNQSQLLLLLALSVKIFPQSLLAGSQLGVLGFLLSLFLSLFSYHPQPSLPLTISSSFSSSIISNSIFLLGTLSLFTVRDLVWF